MFKFVNNTPLYNVGQQLSPQVYLNGQSGVGAQPPQGPAGIAFAWYVGSNSYLPYETGMGRFGGAGPYQRVMPGGIHAWRGASSGAAGVGQMVGGWRDPMGRGLAAIAGMPPAVMNNDPNFMRQYAHYAFDQAQKRSQAHIDQMKAKRNAEKQAASKNQGNGITVADIEKKGFTPEEAEKIHAKAFADKTPEEQKKLYKYFPDVEGAPAEQKAMQLANWYAQVARGEPQDKVTDLYKKAVTKSGEKQEEVEVSAKDGTYYSKDGKKFGTSSKGAKFKYDVSNKVAKIFEKKGGQWVPKMTKEEGTDYDIGRMLDNLDNLIEGKAVNQSVSGASNNSTAVAGSDSDDSDEAPKKISKGGKKGVKKVKPAVQNEDASVDDQLAELKNIIRNINNSNPDVKIKFNATSGVLTINVKAEASEGDADQIEKFAMGLKSKYPALIKSISMSSG